MPDKGYPIRFSWILLCRKPASFIFLFIINTLQYSLRYDRDSLELAAHQYSALCFVSVLLSRTISVSVDWYESGSG